MTRNNSLHNEKAVVSFTKQVFPMKSFHIKRLSVSLMTLLLTGNSLYAQTHTLPPQPLNYVNTMIGTDGMGHTFPGACAPFGIVQLSPDTDTIPHNVNGKYQKQVYNYCAGYRHSDNTIVGFSHTHLSGTGHSDLGDILIMPQTGKLLLHPGRKETPDEGYRQRYTHDTEHTEPGYYEVTLADNGIRCQLTATQRVGIHRYTFPDNTDRQRIIIDLIHAIYNYDGKVLWASLKVENDTLLTGYRITNGWARNNYTFFAISFSKPFINYGYRDMKPEPYKGFWGKFDKYHNFPDMAGRSIVSYFEFASDENNIEIKVALSAVSTDGALRNLKNETEGRTFSQIVTQTQQAWQRELSTITCEGTDDEKTMVYTAFYHTMINPSIFMDVDRHYRGIDGNIHLADDFDNYTIFSLWDTYRALHPLLALLKPTRNTHMVRSMLKHQQQSTIGMLPVWSLMGNEGWCMTGYHAVSVVADAIVKGADIPQKEALTAMETTANNSYFPNLSNYIAMGYAPYDNDKTAASNTLEYAYDDWTIYNAARHTGDKVKETIFRKRANNYRNIYNPISGFATPRYSNGTFKADFNPYQTYNEGFIEGNSWNFSFHVPHDVNGLMQHMGGEKIFRNRLDTLFNMHLPEKYYKDNEDITADCLIGGYVHGNEPSHHIPYLYAWTSTPWKSQQCVRNIMNKMYRNDIRGLGGNDDCGQMSAWYIFSAMGFYPVCPGSNQYVIGAPYLPYMKVMLENGNTIEIRALGVSDKNCYVQSLKINGQPYEKMYITHEMLTQGCTLEFQMGSRPNRNRGQKPTDKPYSLSNEMISE